jgi:glycosyltransferase involved in cell wall biosynthesis
MTEELREEVEALGLAEVVTLLGHRTDIGDLHASHDAFCFPSLWEGQGNALLEAMACGRPAIVSDIPVLREVVGDGGIFARPGDESSFADAMVQFADLGTEALAALGCRARDWVERRYDAELKLRQLVDHYRALAM